MIGVQFFLFANIIHFLDMQPSACITAIERIDLYGCRLLMLYGADYGLIN